MKKILLSLIIILLAIYCFTPVKYNSKYKLNIVSSYGDDEAYHPKVLSFKKKWNGYKYWMSYTPYPKGNDSKENPHIVASNDLVSWKKIYTFDRPLNTPESIINNVRYNSDSHIVYNDDLDELELYWRYVDNINKDVYLYRMISKNGTDWTDKEVAAYSKERFRLDYVSPAILYENGIYKMWFVDHDLTIKYTTSTDGISWDEPQTLDFKYENNVKTWHLDVINSDLGYEMIVVAFDEWKHHNNMDLYYSKSKDGINWDMATVILKPTRGTNLWDSRGIYRSSFVKINGTYFVYYGGTSKNLHHGLGLVYGKDIHNLNSTNVNFSNKKESDKFAKKIEGLLK